MAITEKDKKTAHLLLQKLTLEEKIHMIHGNGLFETGAVPRLGIPALKMTDGPMGVRREYEKDRWLPVGLSDDFVTYLPSNSAIAATWNRHLAHRCGQVLGAETRGRGKDVVLAPGINIKRSPLCGRNFEYMSEDPYLTAQQCVPLIQGIQENDVAACVKHFALNNQERNRLWVNVEAEERALREIYFPAFEAAAKEAGVLTVMGAYNLVRGIRCCENSYLLDAVLREEWGFEGATVSDWGGILRTKESAMVGMDLEMSIYSNFDEYFFAEPLLEAMRNGEIPEEVVDAKVFHVLCVMSALHMLKENGKSSVGKCRKSGSYNASEHRAAALETARESIVLLKNEEHILPLSKDMDRLLVVGCNADTLHAGGGGSAEIRALYEISPLLGLKMQLGGNTDIAFMPGYYVPENQGQQENWQEDSLSDRGGTTAKEEIVTEEQQRMRQKLLEEAVQLAKEYKHVIFVGGLNHQHDLEDQDRRDMKLPYGQDALIDALLKANPNTVLVMCAGSPVDMEAFADRAKAIVWNWYAGAEGGNALAEVLLGKVNPSGKLPETFPKDFKDCSAHCIGEFGKSDTTVYKEGIFVGYRYYDTYDVPVRYPFGHGLSYTEFAYRDLKLSVTKEGEHALERVTALLYVKNTGKYRGKEIVQLYVSKTDSIVERPKKELKGYEKIELLPGEEKIVKIEFDVSALSYWEEKDGCMQVEVGEYEVQIGASSADIRVRDVFTIAV